MKYINIYTDGSSIGNPGPGGYAFITEFFLLFNNKKINEFFEGFRYTTNNRMELLAVIVALENIKKLYQNIKIFTDSKYIIESVEKKWVFKWEKNNFKKKKNIDLWKRFLIVYRKHNIIFHWIKAHNKHIQNERCHYLAIQAAKNKYSKIDIEFEKNNQLLKL